MTGDFWDFWHPGEGFDKSAWFEAYKRTRAQEPLKKDRTRRNPVSNTRRIIDLVVEAAKPVQCLETNLYAEASPTASDLPRRSRSTEVFDFLLRTIKPTLLVAHGSEAAEHLKAYREVEVWTEGHFSRGWSFDQARDLGRRIRSHAAAG
jgi:hypothetical protein